MGKRKPVFACVHRSAEEIKADQEISRRFKDRAMREQPALWAEYELALAKEREAIQTNPDHEYVQPFVDAANELMARLSNAIRKVPKGEK